MRSLHFFGLDVEEKLGLSKCYYSILVGYLLDLGGDKKAKVFWRCAVLATFGFFWVERNRRISRIGFMIFYFINLFIYYCYYFISFGNKDKFHDILFTFGIKLYSWLLFGHLIIIQIFPIFIINYVGRIFCIKATVSYYFIVVLLFCLWSLSISYFLFMYKVLFLIQNKKKFSPYGLRPIVVLVHKRS